LYCITAFNFVLNLKEIGLSLHGIGGSNATQFGFFVG